MVADETTAAEIESEVDEGDVPEEVESTVADVLMSLEDKVSTHDRKIGHITHSFAGYTFEMVLS